MEEMTNFSACLRAPPLKKPGFRYSEGVQFRATITYRTPLNLDDAAIVDCADSDGRALMSYHALLRANEYDSKSRHMADLLKLVGYHNVAYTYQDLKNAVGTTCPGMKRFYKEIQSSGSGSEEFAARRLYHRCAVALASRLGNSYTVGCLEEDAPDDCQLGEWEYVRPSEHDRLGELLLGHRRSFFEEASTGHVYTEDAGDLTRHFVTFLEGRPSGPRGCKPTTAEILIQRNLLALQVVHCMKKNGDMLLERVGAGTWENRTEDTWRPYQNAGTLIWMIFCDPTGLRSVAVVHGVHRPALTEPLPLEPVVTVGNRDNPFYFVR